MAAAGWAPGFAESWTANPYTLTVLGAAATVLFCLGLVGLGKRLFSRLLAGLDPAAQIGLAGLLGLGVAGWLTFPIGHLPGGLRWGIWVIVAMGIAGLGVLAFEARKTSWRINLPKDWRLIMLGLLLLSLFGALVGVLGPSDLQDWDSLAYHLAVPKLWLQAGQIEYVPFIHQSNFPFVVDNLYIWGLAWGGEQGAKTFTLAYSVFGAISLFGIARSTYGEKAAWWTALVFSTIPVVLWESGTAYIDVAHGVWSGLAVLLLSIYTSKNNDIRILAISAICLGFSLATKYTGVQIALAVGTVLLLAGILDKRLASGVKNCALLAAFVLMIAAPWFIRNLLSTGNPVYPFYYEAFDGRNWDQWRADIYRNEQLSFGVGRADGQLNIGEFPHAVLGLAYQPGRYVNPGQSEGNGFPTGAIGVVGMGALLLWLASGRARRFEMLVVTGVGVCFILWFFLSQQSRYAANMAVPLCVLAGGAIARLRAGPALAVLAVGQAAYTLWLVKTVTVEPKLPVLLGSLSADEYRRANIPFFGASQRINEVARDGKVALYDEVFGYFLDVPYFWANPGHSTLIPYERMDSGTDFVLEMRNLGFTHVYVSIRFWGPTDAKRWIEAAGLDAGPARRYETTERQRFVSDLQLKWRLLVAEASADRLLMLELADRSGVLFSIQR